MRAFPSLVRSGLVAGVALWGAASGPAFARPAAPATVRLAGDPALSPDGKWLAFAWAGDVWLVASTGGDARRLTSHPATDRNPAFSPDGTQIAFTSEREDGRQVFRMPVAGGVPEQVTWHTAGYTIDGWTADGSALLCSSPRDHFWRYAHRFFTVALTERRADRLWFDAAGRGGALSPDGTKLLFMREGATWWRKGYAGSRAAQIWLYDRGSAKFTKVVEHPTGCRWPRWKPDGTGFYYVCGKDGCFNLYERGLDGTETQLTRYADDAVIQPAVSRDGSTIVFRRLGELWRFEPGGAAAPQRLDIRIAADVTPPRVERRTLTKASDAAFSADGLEVAFIAGHDVWVMDTELREPVQVTDTPAEEHDLVFTPDGALLFVSEQGGQPDIWRVQRGDATKYWWQQRTFERTRLTEDPDSESDLKLAPDGTTLGFIKGRGDFWVMGADGTGARQVIASWSGPEYDFSPDSKWIVYAQSDDDFNRDIWVQPLDGSRERFNLSRHPDNESDPVWSPDGKAIAFTGRRHDQEVDIYYVYLRNADDDRSARDRKLEKALEKMQKGRKAKSTAKPKKDDGRKDDGKKDDGKKDDGTKDDGKKDDGKKDDQAVRIDFDRIHERVRRIAIPDATETNLLWSPDSKRLAFEATIGGKKGTYTVSPPDDLKPKLLATATGTHGVWVKKGNQIRWLSGGAPATLSGSGKPAAYTFRARQTVDLPAHFQAGFDQAWRAMRDWFYDGRFHNRDWNAVRAKYRDLAADAQDPAQLAVVISLMLGELNASHLGFYPPRAPAGGRGGRWPVQTAHLGLRFDSSHTGAGWKVRDVITDGPADRAQSRVAAGEVVLRIDGTAVTPATDPAQVLNGTLDRTITLTVADAAGAEREVHIRPISFDVARRLLYEQWIRDTRRRVEELSHGTLGYLHIRGMNWPSFLRFERELYAAGHGKDGLVIDVRENGGGFTADHLLTALTQPDHAITVPRGGGPGYPHDRRVYATWDKPIVVLCNQNSFSNAEIFSHAIKTLKRGHLVGVRTAGGVISTGITDIMDLGKLRMPFRAWFLLKDGEDMELNGCLPDHVVWPKPGEWPAGVDTQLQKAVTVLLTDVAEWKARPKPTLRYASER